jgi:peroxiredoxin
MALQPGTPAPDFTLKSQSAPVTLSDLRGKIVVVGFHPASFTGG